MTEILTVLDTLQKVGTLGLVLLVLYGGARPASKSWWVFGEIYRDALANRDKQIEQLRRERDQALDIVLEQGRTTSRAAELAESVVTGQRSRR